MSGTSGHFSSPAPPSHCPQGHAGRWGKHKAFPSASRLFASIDAGLDESLRRHGLDRDIAFCAELAARSPAEQPEFLSLYLADPADARYWASLPRWKRPIRKGDKTDQYIWKWFVQQRLLMDSLASGRAIDWKAQGFQLTVMAGALRYITDIQRFSLFLSIFGDMLQAGENLGNVVRPPWASK
jgi:hypothetical protein